MQRTFAIEAFPGLRLDEDPVDLGIRGARIARSVWVDGGGALVTRDGEEDLALQAGEARGCRVHYGETFGTDMLIDVRLSAVAETTFTARNISSLVATTLVDTPSPLGRGPNCVQSFKSAAGNHAYVIGAIAMKRWTGSAWASSASGQIDGASPIMLGRLPISNRLVALTQAAGNRRLWFSNPDDGEVFDVAAGNFVDLPFRRDPTCMVEWDEKLFVFSPNECMVFGAPEIGADGEASFIGRPLAVGADAACAGRTGIFTATPKGLARTTGGPAQTVSQAIDPLLRDVALPFSGTAGEAGISGGEWVACEGPRVHARFTGRDAIFTLNEDTGSWVSDERPAVQAVGYERLGGGLIWLDEEQVPGSVVTWRQREGLKANVQDVLYELGAYTAGGDEEKVLRRTALVGQGQVGVQMRSDHKVLDSIQTVTMGSVGLGTVARAWDLRARRGRRFGLRLSGIGEIAVLRVEHHVGRPRSPASQTP